MLFGLAWAASLHAASIRGRVQEDPGGAPIPGASVEIPVLRLGTSTGETGDFRLAGLPPGVVRVLVRHTGFRELTFDVVVGIADTTLAPIQLAHLPVPVPGVEVHGQARGDRFASQRPVEVAGARLRERLAPTIAEVLANEPGLAERTLGPSPARPVLRGLGGDRLLVLENGLSAGDLSATSDDHAVTIEPASIQAVEVLRGPATYALGSNVLAGLVNVRRDYVPDHVPDRVAGTALLQAESATSGTVGMGRLTVPWNGWALNAQASDRTAGDLQTAEGRLPHTSLRSNEFASGLSHIGPHSRIGGSFAKYESRYGIPGGFLGGHEKGSDIDLERDRSEVLLELQPGPAGSPRLELDGLYTRYYHQELESNGVPAISFGLLTYTTAARLRWDPAGPLGRGVVGVSGEYRDFQSGFLTFTPPTLERAGAVFGTQEWGRGRWSLTAGARVDARFVVPADRDTNKAGVIRRRGFSGASGGLQVEWRTASSLSVTGAVMSTFLAPSVEHLFAEGPHLASYSYEVGNADLGAEEGLGMNLALRAGGTASHASLAVFRNSFGRYLYAANTGQLEVGPGANGLLARYRFRGEPATLSGGEIESVLQLAREWWIEGSGSYVRGTLRGSGLPLPSIPPLKGHVALRWQQSEWTAHLALTGAAAQHRLGEFETPTAAWLTTSCGAGWTLSRAARQISAQVTVNNLFNAEYRDHLSRIKSVMPEAGRNIRLTIQALL